MSSFQFKRAIRCGANDIELYELTPAQRKRIRSYERAITVAAKSQVPNPPFSNYFVQTSVGTAGGDVVPAGNIEYVICQALHGEESAVAAFRARYGRRRKTGQPILAFSTSASAQGLAMCGNCRDIVLEDLGPNTEVVAGNPRGGLAIVTGFDQCLVDEFASCEVDPTIFGSWVTQTWSRGQDLVSDPYSPTGVHDERKYAALVMTLTGHYFGARDIKCDYHPIYALRDALRAAERARDPHVVWALIVGEGDGSRPPHVIYKDRQHLMEMTLYTGLLNDFPEYNPLVHLATVDPVQGRITGSWRTTVHDWLPLAFSPRAFGPEYLKTLTEWCHRRFDR